MKNDETSISGQTTSNPKNKSDNISNANKTNNHNDKKARTLYPPWETCRKVNHSAGMYFFRTNAANRPPRNRKPTG